MTSIDQLQQKWKIRWPNLQDSVSRLIGAALTAATLIFAGWALQRNDALGGFATFLTVTGSSLLAWVFRPARSSFDEFDPQSFRGQLVAWVRDYPVISWLANPQFWRVLGAVGFGALIVVLEGWVHTLFGEDPARPSIWVTLATLAIVLVPAFTWTGYLAELKLGRSAKVDKLGAIITGRIKHNLASTALGRAFLLALVRTLGAVLMRVLGLWVIPLIFNTQQATWAVACLLALAVVYHDTIFDSMTHGPKLLKIVHSLTTENAALKEQIATLRAQVAVLQVAPRPSAEERSRDVDPT